MNWLVIVVLLILLICGLSGYRRGFIKTVFSLISIIIALIVSSVVSPMVSASLRENPKFYQQIYDRVEEMVVSQSEQEEEIKKTSEETSYIENLSLPEALKKTLIENNNKDTYRDLAVDTFEDYVVSTITVLVINTIGYIICTIGLIVILFILSHALNLISKLPLLNGLNRAAGLVVGLFGGCIAIWIFFLVITVFSASPLGKNIFQMINDSQILTFIYENNLLLKGITEITGGLISF